MTFPDYPPGQWSILLVGAQWVSISAVAALNSAITNRGAVQTNFSQLHDTLQNALTTTLAGQEGATADAIRDAFRQGAEQAAQVAEKNGAYKTALQQALDSVQHLRDKLAAIAKEGNDQIEKENQSNDKFDEKVVKIAAIIADHQRQANQAAGECAFSVVAAGQKVVDAQGEDQSFFGMANGAGINANQQPDQQAIEGQVRGMLTPQADGGAGGVPAPTTANGLMSGSGANTVPGAPAPTGLMSGGTANAVPNTPAPAAPAPTGLMSGGTANAVPNAPAPAAPAPTGLMSGGSANAVPGGLPSAAQAGFSGGAPGFGQGFGGMSPGQMASPGGMAPMSGMGAPTGMSPAAAMGGAATPPVAPPANAGLPTGAPLGGPGAPGGLGGGPVQPVAPQVPQTAPTFPSAATGTPVTATDAPAPTPSAPAANAAPSTAYTPPSASPMMSGASSTPMPMAPAPSGPLPTYGSDLVRPPVAASPSAPPMMASVSSATASPLSQPPVSPAVSGSATVHPSAAGGPANVSQSAVVRPTVVPNPAQSPPGVGTQGVIAAGGGALAGAASADATARRRLQRLVGEVARQQPRLAWAIGDRPDGTTILVTDLASGWIPSGIEIPSAITLLEPARRRGDIEALLGEVQVAAAVTPGHYQPDPDPEEPVPTSSRPRRAPEVEELNWELTDAARRSNRLTRLAHTCAIAASKNTGVLESEAIALHDQLATLADRVLDSYPDHVDHDEVGNWQLLSAIESLVVGDRISANYHLAWFLACNTAAAERIS